LTEEGTGGGELCSSLSSAGDRSYLLRAGRQWEFAPGRPAIECPEDLSISGTAKHAGRLAGGQAHRHHRALGGDAVIDTLPGCSQVAAAQQRPGGTTGLHPQQEQPPAGEEGTAEKDKPPLGSGGMLGEQDKSELQGAAAGVEETPREPGGPPVKLTKDQEAKLRSIIMSQTIMQEPNANVSLRRGARVPPGMNLMSLPPEAEKLVPEYRGYHYVITANRILIVHAESRLIEGMIPA
jgi:hypothetical protein